MKKTILISFLIVLIMMLFSCQSVKTTAPTTTATVCPPTHPSKDYLFDSYDELQEALLGSESQAFQQTVAQEAPSLTPMLTCFTQANKVPFPRLNDEPMDLLGDGYIYLFEKELYDEPFLLYHCEYEETHIRVRISDLSLFDVKNESEKSDVAKLISAISTDNITPDHYEHVEWVKSVVDEEITLNGKTVLARMVDAKEDKYYDQIHFLYNGYYVMIEAPDFTQLDSDFLANFSID